MIEDIILGLIPPELSTYATIGTLPGTKKNEICIIMFDGAGNFEYFGGRTNSTIYQPIIKVIVRNHSYETAREWVDSIQEALHRYSDAGAGIEGSVLSVFLVGVPMYLGKDEQKFHEFQLTFNINVKE